MWSRESSLRSTLNDTEVSVIKECLNTVFDHRDVVLNLSIFDEFFNKHPQLDINLLASSRTIEELIANLKGTEYYAPVVAARGYRASDPVRL